MVCYFKRICGINQAEDRVTWPDLLHRHTIALASFREWSVVSARLRIRAQPRNPCRARNSASAWTCTQGAVFLQRGAALPRGAIATWPLHRVLFVSSSGTVANGLKGAFTQGTVLPWNGRLQVHSPVHMAHDCPTIAIPLIVELAIYCVRTLFSLLIVLHPIWWPDNGLKL